jgi:hypothetical protein
LTVKSFFLRTFDLGMGTFGRVGATAAKRCDDGADAVRAYLS